MACGVHECMILRRSDAYNDLFKFKMKKAFHLCIKLRIITWQREIRNLCIFGILMKIT